VCVCVCEVFSLSLFCHHMSWGLASMSVQTALANTPKQAAVKEATWGHPSSSSSLLRECKWGQRQLETLTCVKTCQESQNYWENQTRLCEDTWGITPRGKREVESRRRCMLANPKRHFLPFLLFTSHEVLLSLQRKRQFFFWLTGFNTVHFLNIFDLKRWNKLCVCLKHDNSKLLALTW